MPQTNTISTKPPSGLIDKGSSSLHLVNETTHSKGQPKSAAQSDVPPPQAASAASGLTQRARTPLPTDIQDLRKIVLARRIDDTVPGYGVRMITTTPERFCVSPNIESPDLSNKSPEEIQKHFLLALPQIFAKFNPVVDSSFFPDLAENLMVYITPLAKALNVDTVSAANSLRRHLIKKYGMGPRNTFKYQTNKSDENASFDPCIFIYLCLRSIRKYHTELEKLGVTFQNHPHFRGLPASDAWRLGIDSDQQCSKSTQAWAGFEIESGYMAGICRGLNFVLQADLAKEPLSADFIINLHHQLTQGVLKGTLLEDIFAEKMPLKTKITTRTKSSRQSLKKYEFQAGFNLRPSVYGCNTFSGIAGETITQQGLHEAYRRSQAKDSSFIIIKVEKDDFVKKMNHLNNITRHDRDMEFKVRKILESTGLKYPSDYTPPSEYTFCTNLPWSLKSPKQRVEKTLADYEVKIKKAQTELEKLSAIVSCCQTLVQMHPFSDGNGRTFDMLLLNRLLIKEGLSPAFLEDQNRFTGFSNAELIEEVQRGQASFTRFLTEPQYQPEHVPKQNPITWHEFSFF
jgi:Fic/DOC family